MISTRRVEGLISGGEFISPFPKNPVIGAFFREIHRADELGSGLGKLMQYAAVSIRKWGKAIFPVPQHGEMTIPGKPKSSRQKYRAKKMSRNRRYVVRSGPNASGGGADGKD